LPIYKQLLRTSFTIFLFKCHSKKHNKLKTNKNTNFITVHTFSMQCHSTGRTNDLKP